MPWPSCKCCCWTQWPVWCTQRRRLERGPFWYSRWRRPQNQHFPCLETHQLTCQEHGKRGSVITHLNKNIHLVADKEEDIFMNVAPLLLGKVLESKMKSHLQSLKCISASACPDKEGKQIFCLRAVVETFAEVGKEPSKEATARDPTSLAQPKENKTFSERRTTSRNKETLF